MKECVTHHICDCHHAKMNRLEVENIRLNARIEDLKGSLQNWLSATPTDKDGKYCGINQSQAKHAAEVLTEMENS